MRFIFFLHRNGARQRLFFNRDHPAWREFLFRRFIPFLEQNRPILTSWNIHSIFGAWRQRQNDGLM
jgi:hypothetical protein